MLTLTEFIRAQADDVVEDVVCLLADTKPKPSGIPTGRYKVSVLGHEAAIAVYMDTADARPRVMVQSPQVRREFKDAVEAIAFWRQVALPDLESHVRDLLSLESARGLDVLGLAAEAVAQDVVTS